MEKEKHNNPIEDAVSAAMVTKPQAETDWVFIYWGI